MGKKAGTYYKNILYFFWKLFFRGWRKALFLHTCKKERFLQVFIIFSVIHPWDTYVASLITEGVKDDHASTSGCWVMGIKSSMGRCQSNPCNQFLQPLPRTTVIKLSMCCVVTRETAHVLCHAALDSLKSTESSTSPAFHQALCIPGNSTATEN